MDNILATTDVIALRASPFYMSVRLGSSLLSRKLLSHPVWSPAGAKRGFIKGWFEWPSFRTEAFRRNDDRDREDFGPQTSSTPKKASGGDVSKKAAEPLFERKAKDVWESIKKEKKTTTQSSSSSSSSSPSSTIKSTQQNRKYSTCMVRSCAASSLLSSLLI